MKHNTLIIAALLCASDFVERTVLQPGTRNWEDFR
jgi:hypothetical protein